MAVWLASAADPSTSAQVDVAPSTGGVDPDTRGIKKNTQPLLLLFRSSPSTEGGGGVHKKNKERAGRFVAPTCITTQLLRGESSLIVRGEN